MPLVLRSNRRPNPSNNASVDIARSTIDKQMGLANKQQENALAVDGFPILYYRRRTNGLRCTCSGGAAAAAGVPSNQQIIDSLEPGVQILDAAGEGSSTYLNSMLHGTVFSINRYGSRQHQVDASGGTNPQRSVPHSPLIQSKEIHNKSTEMDDPFVDQVEAGELSDLFGGAGESEISVIEGTINAATATASCAVCLGTSFVGGYTPSNAYRAVYDVQAPWSGDITWNKTSLPNKFELFATGDGSEVSIDVMLPRGAVGVEAMRVWNNRDQIGDVEIFVEEMGCRIKPGVSLARLCDGRLHKFVLKFGAAVAAFTHFELQLEMGVQPVYAAWSKLNFSENLQLPENLDTPNITISPSLPQVALYDIVTESVYRKMWKITSSTPSFDRKRHVMGWEAICRLLQAYELPQLLPRRHDRTWYWGNVLAVQPGNDVGHKPHNPYK